MLSGFISKGHLLAQKTIFELDLINLAKWQRRCSIAAILIILSIITMWIGSTFALVYGLNITNISIGFWGLYFLTTIVSAALVFPTHRAMGYGLFSSIIWTLFAILIPLLVLLSISSTAGLILRLSGAKTGLFGVSKDTLDRIRPRHCRECGYSRDGLELLQECPECQRVPQVI